MRILSIGCLLLMVIGALNWGMIGLFKFNVIEAIFGRWYFASIIYILVGLAGLYGAFMLARLWSKKDDICVPGDTDTYSS